MLVGHLDNIENEINYYPRAIQKGIRFLLENDLESLPSGLYKIEDEKIFAKVSEYYTEVCSNRRPERHDKYIDIQCIVSGKEKIGYARKNDISGIYKDKLKENDVIYYDNVIEETYSNLLPNMFAVYFPWDVHRPNCNADENSIKVKKIVIKIAQTELES